MIFLKHKALSYRSLLALVITFLCNCQSGHSQRRLFHTWTNPSFKQIQIESDHLSKISFRSHSENTVILYTRSEGEIVANSIITLEESGDNLNIGTDFTPFYQPKNDKLAAHKVIAIELILVVPTQMSIDLRAAIANVYGSGTYKSFNAELENGFIKLHSFRGNAHLLSKWGAIEVKAESGVSGTANSKYNTIENNLPKSQIYLVKAESMHGPIKLLQTKKL